MGFPSALTEALDELAQGLDEIVLPDGLDGEAFRELSELMLRYNPDEPLFLDDIGSYYLVCQGDSKKALKYYNKVLKKHPDDLTAIQNCILLARKEKNVKLEKKYLPMLIKYSPDETDRTSARMRLESISGKK